MPGRSAPGAPWCNYRRHPAIAPHLEQEPQIVRLSQISQILSRMHGQPVRAVTGGDDGAGGGLHCRELSAYAEVRPLGGSTTTTRNFGGGPWPNGALDFTPICTGDK